MPNSFKNSIIKKAYNQIEVFNLNKNEFDQFQKGC